MGCRWTDWLMGEVKASQELAWLRQPWSPTKLLPGRSSLLPAPSSPSLEASGMRTSPWREPQAPPCSGASVLQGFCCGLLYPGLPRAGGAREKQTAGAMGFLDCSGSFLGHSKDLGL